MSLVRNAVLISALTQVAHADPPLIESAVFQGNRISVTLSHPDTGWDHYANGWTVYAPDGTELEARVLLHSLVEEQPFTRNLTLSALPKGLSVVDLIATCNHQARSEAFRLTLD